MASVFTDPNFSIADTSARWTGHMEKFGEQEGFVKSYELVAMIVFKANRPYLYNRDILINGAESFRKNFLHIIKKPERPFLIHCSMGKTV